MNRLSQTLHRKEDNVAKLRRFIKVDICPHDFYPCLKITDFVFFSDLCVKGIPLEVINTLKYLVVVSDGKWKQIIV